MRSLLNRGAEQAQKPPTPRMKWPWARTDEEEPDHSPQGPADPITVRVRTFKGWKT